MVFLTNFLLRAKSKPGPHKFWKKRRILSLAGHFYGRRRRVYAYAIRGIHRSFLHSRNNRATQPLLRRRVWETRLNAACAEFDTDYESMRKTLQEIDVGLDRKSLQNLAIWEPRSFRGLAMLTKAKTQVQGLNSLDPPPKGVITRGML